MNETNVKPLQTSWFTVTIDIHPQSKFYYFEMLTRETLLHLPERLDPSSYYDVRHVKVDNSDKLRYNVIYPIRKIPTSNCL